MDANNLIEGREYLIETLDNGNEYMIYNGSYKQISKSQMIYSFDRNGKTSYFIVGHELDRVIKESIRQKLDILLNA